MTAMEVQFDDFERLSTLISEEFGCWGNAVTVTQDMVNQFADLSGDYQWIHVDPERARNEGPFGAPVAHGMLVLSMVPSIMPANSWLITGYGAALNYGSDGIRFISPVLVDAKIHARSRLAAAERHARGSLLTIETEVREVDGKKPAMLYRAQVLYMPRRP